MFHFRRFQKFAPMADDALPEDTCLYVVSYVLYA